MRYLTWSMRGSQHQQNQDCAMVNTTQDRFLVSLTDGVSTCCNAQQGAQIACRAALDYLTESNGNDSPHDLLAAVTKALKDQAEREGDPFESYSSTLFALSFKVGEFDSRLAYYSIGDSMLIGVVDHEVKILSYPDLGVDGVWTTTHAAAERHLSYQSMSADGIQAVIVLTDGCWRPLFRNCRMKDECRLAFAHGDFQKIQRYLEDSGVSDDASAVILHRT